ncbi:predicted protein [Lichtheimia corymbifera JMRC:FSU:9682]|uniref:Uncharacterized protein n=1 Tax=Lichtheimia corymbifera JMRC:FSU:9682 TaxID=1263082 RepID=A0A068S0J4_9FUNG|nr:predicted protein [Lichtheimia corymbifera JMRC:FSU:9682]
MEERIDNCQRHSGNESTAQFHATNVKADLAKNREAYKERIDEFFDQVRLQPKLYEYRGAYFDLPYDTNIKEEQIHWILERLGNDHDMDVETRINLTRALIYVSLGAFGDPCTVRSESALLNTMVSNNKLLYASGTTHVIGALINKSDTDGIEELDGYITVLYVMLSSCYYDHVLMDSDQLLELLECLINILTNITKPISPNYPMKKLLALVHMLLLAIFGTTDDAATMRQQIKDLWKSKSCNTSEQPLKCTPHDLYDFRRETKAKYVSYQPPQYPFAMSSEDNIRATKEKNDSIYATTSISAPNDMPYRIRFPPKHPAKAMETIPSVIEFKKDLERSQSTTPFTHGTPTSIKETGDLLISNMHISTYDQQVIMEREHAEKHSGSHQHDCDAINTRDQHIYEKQPVLLAVEKLYTKIMPKLPDFVNVLLDQLVTIAPSSSSSSSIIDPLQENVDGDLHADNNTQRNREIVRSTLTSILLLLLKWFKLSHALKFEYMSQLLVDSGYMLLSVRAFMTEDLKEITCYSTDNRAHGFFGQILSLEPKACNGNIYPPSCSTSSSSSSSSLLSNVSLAKSWDESIPWTANEVSDDMKITNKRNISWILDTLRNLQMITKRKVCRNKMMALYKSYIPLKRIVLANRGTDLELYALKLLKSQITHLGIKWRAGNMKLISAIYRRCSPRLRDEWLTTREFDGDRDAEDMVHEMNIRALICFYHETRYAFTTLSDTSCFEATANIEPESNGWGDSDMDASQTQWPSLEKETSFDDRWDIGTPAPDATPQPITADALADAINHLYRQPARKFKTITATEAEGDGWDTPALTTSNTFSFGKKPTSGSGTDSEDDDDDDDLEMERKSQDDPLKNIDWETLTEDELMDRMTKVSEQCEQRWLSVDIDDPAYCKVLIDVEGYNDNEAEDGGNVDDSKNDDGWQ